jgi:hypothetical protein
MGYTRAWGRWKKLPKIKFPSVVWGEFAEGVMKSVRCAIVWYCAHKLLLLLLVRVSCVAATVCRRKETGIWPGGFTPKTGLNVAHKLMLLVFVAVKVKLILGREETTVAVGSAHLTHTSSRRADLCNVRQLGKGRLQKSPVTRKAGRNWSWPTYAEGSSLCHVAEKQVVFLCSSIRLLTIRKTWVHFCILTYYLLFIYLWGWSGNECTITAAIYCLIVPALDHKWWWLWSS